MFAREDVLTELSTLIPLANTITGSDYLLADTASGEPTCRRLWVAGSIRRGHAQVKDCEIVCWQYGVRLLEHTDLLLRQGFIEKARYGKSRQTRWGEKYRGFMLTDKSGLPLGIKYELFIGDESNFGWIHLLRTGSGGEDGFSAFIVRRLQRRGYTVKDGTISKGDPAHGGAQYYVTDEAQVLALAGLPMIPPKYREARYISTIAQRYAEAA